MIGLCTWRRVSARWLTPLTALCICFGCTPSDHASEIEERVAAERIETHRSEAELPQLIAPTDTQRTLFQEARTALRDGDTTTALKTLEALKNSDTLSALKRDGTLLYASLLESRGDRTKARETLETLVLNIPPSGDVFLVLGRLQQADGDLDEAERALRDATRSSPELLRAWIALAQLLENQGKHEAADNVMLHYERQVYRLGDAIERDTTLEKRLEAIAQLRIALPDPRVSRILASALKNDAFDVQSAALDALENVGTTNAIDAIRAYQESVTSAKLRDRADSVLKAIEARQE